MTQPMQLTERTYHNHSELNLRRKQGHIPAAVYGKKIGSISVEVNEQEITTALHHNPHAVFQVMLPEYGQQSVLIREVQKHSVSGKILHIDFLQINANETVDTKVTLHLIGEPVGIKNGGILQRELHEVEVRCMADKLFTTFEVDTSSLAIGDHLLVSDLAFPEGVEILTDPSSMVAKVLAPTVIPEPAVTE